MKKRESELEKENPRGDMCQCCRKRKLSVSDRPDCYANDVENDPTARHTVCDECDYENFMDI